MEIVYVDTCVYRDYYEWRPGRVWLHYGEEAKKLFARIENGEFELIVSDHLAWQLKGFPQYDQYVAKIDSNKRLVKLTVAQSDREKANQERTEFEDALHATLAIRGHASYFATDNVEDFACFSERLKIRRPELVGVF